MKVPLQRFLIPNIVTDSLVIYVLKVAYDGSQFFGAQRQPDHQTVLAHLETILNRVLGRPVKLSIAGRTDTGVHALGQVVAFQLDQRCDLGKLTHGINSMARAPLTVLESAMLEDETNFHPRHSAVERCYNYLFVDDCCHGQRLFWNGRAWALGGRLDPTSLRAASQVLLGEHDFSTFTYNPDPDMTRIRKLHRIVLHEEPLPPLFSRGRERMWRLEIAGNAFLRRMVRALTSALVRVGLGLDSPDQLQAALRAADPQLGPPPAPAYGLYFKSVLYSPDPFELGRQTGNYCPSRPSTKLSFRDHLRDS